MRKRIMFLILLTVLLFSGCQTTPEESAVVSKSEGVNENVIAKPMKEDEIRKTDIPVHWQMKELKSNDRITISADLELGEQEIGNLPIIEMKNHILTQNELEILVDYFANGKEIYIPQPYTKEVYRSVIDRIENKDGFYASSYPWLEHLTFKQRMESALEMAPETYDLFQKADVKFTTRFVDKAYEEAVKDRFTYENRNENIWFEADVGENRDSTIQAETYDSKVGNSSSFSWMKGGQIWEYSQLLSSIMFYEKYGDDDSEFTPKMLERLYLFESYYEQGKFDKDVGKEQAKRVLMDLGIDEMSLRAEECILWFSNEDCSKGELIVGKKDDRYWQLEPSKAEFGYSYTFSRAIAGLNAISGNSDVAVYTEDMYSPPFPVETITITVTESGVKSFLWEGMAEEVGVVADNTELLSFDRIQEQLVNQLFYRYTGYHQPENDTTKYLFEVKDAAIGYTYITAYENPENAWLVPAWFFTVTEGKDGMNWQTLTFLIEALEGRVIIGE